jgi:serine/threonine protein kinase
VGKKETEGERNDFNFNLLQTMAPECLSERRYSDKSDIWAFGIIVVEVEFATIVFLSGFLPSSLLFVLLPLRYKMFTRDAPYPGVAAVDVAIEVGTCRLRPDVPEYCPRSFVATLKRCWAYDASERVTLKEMLMALEFSRDEILNSEQQ